MKAASLKKYLLAVLLQIVLYSSNIYSQPTSSRFINFSSKDGLVDKYLYSATQDKKGYMWFGTATGLYRYDGHQFKKFRSNIDKPGRSISNILQSVFTDNAGNIWLGGLNTLQWYNPERNKFWQPDEKVKTNKKLFDAYIINFSAGKLNSIYIATSKQYFFRFNTLDSTFFHFGPYYPVHASRNCLQVYEFNQTILAIHDEGIYQFSMDGRLIAFFEYAKADISSSAIDSNNNCIWLATFSNGLIKFSFSDKKYYEHVESKAALARHNLLAITLYDSDKILLGGYELYHINKNNALSKLSSETNDNEFGLFNIKVASFFTDREKNVWICGHNGLSLKPWQNDQVVTIALQDNNKNAIDPISAYEVPGTDDYLITNATSPGLIYLNGLQNKTQIIDNSINKIAQQKSIKGLITTADKKVFVSDDINFFQFNLFTKKLIPFPLMDQNELPIKNVRRSVLDQNGIIYIGSQNNGFYIWNSKSNNLWHVNKWELDSSLNKKDDNEIYPTLRDSKGNIWFTSNNGVYVLNVSQGKYYHHAHKSIEGVPAMGASNYIAEDTQGHIWITTLQNGIYELYFLNGSEVLKNYTQNSGIGLPADYNKKILVDPIDGAFWISNVTGLIKFNPINKKVLTIINKQNGFVADGGYTFSISSKHKLLQLFYGSLNTVDLEAYKYNLMLPEIAFNSIKVLDQEYVYLLKENNEKIRLKNNENFLQFEFAALLFNNANQNQYRYKLEGLSNEWVYSGRNNVANYSGLKPGNYTFIAAAANNDGVWGEEKKIKIEILSPFYATWWFITLSAVAFFGLLFFFYQYRINKVRDQEKLKAGFQQQIAETEMKALRAQMNPHFIFNSLNSINRYILKKEPATASHYLVRFSKLIRLILDHSNQNTISLQSEIELLELYVEMEQLRFEESFSYQLHIEKFINPENTFIPSMLIQPFVENAIRHGLLYKKEKGNLAVIISKEEHKMLQIVIEDNGVGRKKAAELKSDIRIDKQIHGMEITNNRIAILNQSQNIGANSEVIDLYDEKRNAAGTKVIISIPIK